MREFPFPLSFLTYPSYKEISKLDTRKSAWPKTHAQGCQEFEQEYQKHYEKGTKSYKKVPKISLNLKICIFYISSLL